MTRAARRRLDALYRRLPRVECRGLCAEACGPIGASEGEVERLEKASGRALSVVDHPGGGIVCSMLDVEPGTAVRGRCTAYEARPLVCRLFGVAEGLLCPEGCKPTRVLTRAEVNGLFAEVRAIGGEFVVVQPVAADAVDAG